MSEFVLRIDMGNAAFDDSPQFEVVQILNELVLKLENCSSEQFSEDIFKLYDTNGNKVGIARVR